MMSDHLFIVMAIEHYNALGMLRSLGEEGIRPVYIAVSGKVALASKSRYISKCHYVETVAEGYRVLLREYGNFDGAHKPFLFCSDDRTIGYLDSHYEEICDRFYCFNAGAGGRVNQYINKARILELAGACGLRYADTAVCRRGEIPEYLSYPVITKSISPNVGGWKSDVHICGCKRELKAAYETIKSPQVLLQHYIEKKNELEYYGFSINHGRDVCFTIAANYLYLIPGYYSPYMNIFEPPHPEIQDCVREMIREIGFEGLFSAEFLVDEKDGLYFLEINLRNATWGYASTCAGMNLPCLWAKGMLEKRMPGDAVIPFEPFRAMVEPVDFGKRVDSGRVPVAQWLKEFREAKCTYYYNNEDIGPYEVLYEDWDRLK